MSRGRIEELKTVSFIEDCFVISNRGRLLGF
jgi:hypothetical protein